MTEERDSPRSFAPIRAFVRERVRSHRSQLVRIGRSHLEKYLKNAGVVSDCHITLKKSHLLFFQEIRAMKT